MSSGLKSKWLWWLIALAIAAGCVYALWSYIFSFQTVTLHYDKSLGYIEIQAPEQAKLYPPSGQAIKLKKGEYRLRNIGRELAPDERRLTIDSNTTIIPITFNLTRASLDRRLTAERAAIETALMSAYPAINQLYRTERGRLYHQGELYGALLVARDQTGDNADTLRVLLQKKGGQWRLRSMPPSPVLSAPVYPDIARSVLVDINQAK